MTRIAIKPPNDAAWKALRVNDVTSTESAALYGLSPYLTEFELSHRKRDGIHVEIEQHERMEWGTDLQDAIASSLARRFGVQVERVVDYMRIEHARMGSSFDFEVYAMQDKIVSDTRLQAAFMKSGPGILEIKNVDRAVFRDQWTEHDDGSLEAPGHIEIQLQHQLHVRDREWGAIGVLVGGNTGKIIVRERDREVGDALEARIVAFWKAVEAGAMPQPSYPDDAAFVTKLYGYAEPGKVLDARGREDLNALAAEYVEAGKREKLAAEDKGVAKAKMLALVGNAERIMLDGYTVSAAMVGPATITYERAGYRSWKLTPKKSAPTKGTP